MARNGTSGHGRCRLAEAIIAAEMAAFHDWLHARAVSPTISEIRAVAEGIRQRELEHFLGHTHDFTARDARQIEALTKAIVNKLLHQPTVRLKAMSTMPEGLQYAEVARDLFGLSSYPPRQVTPTTTAIYPTPNRLDACELPLPLRPAMALTAD